MLIKRERKNGREEEEGEGGREGEGEGGRQKGRGRGEERMYLFAMEDDRVSIGVLEGELDGVVEGREEDEAELLVTVNRQCNMGLHHT